MVRVCRVAALLTATLFVHAALTGPVGAQNEAGTVDIIRSLAGTWKAPEYKVAASSDLDVQVWGRGASKVRNVLLSLEPSGEGILRVQTSVVDSRGRTKQYSAAVVEARLRLEAPKTWAPGRIEPVVKVVSAEKRYLDGFDDRSTVDGLTVSLHTPSPDSEEINFRYDTLQGSGSFGETLVRQRKGRTSSAPGRSAESDRS